MAAHAVARRRIATAIQRGRLGLCHRRHRQRAFKSRKTEGLVGRMFFAQAGTSSAPTGFVQKRCVSRLLCRFPVQVRLLFQAGDGSVFTQTDDNVGWFVDDLTVTGASLLTNPVLVTNNTGGTFVLRACHRRPARALCKGRGCFKTIRWKAAPRCW